jgi:hypothetical protein
LESHEWGIFEAAVHVVKRAGLSANLRKNRPEFAASEAQKQAPMGTFPLSTRYWAAGWLHPQFVVQNKVAKPQHIGC